MDCPPTKVAAVERGWPLQLVEFQLYCVAVTNEHNTSLRLYFVR